MTKRQPDERKLAGLAEAAEILGVSKHSVWQYMKRDRPGTRDFPDPIEYLAATPVWRVSALERWGKKLPLPVGRPEKGRKRKES